MQDRTQPSSLRGDTRLRIIDSAAKSFARDGFKASTLKHIALAADVNEITVSRYFPHKSDLYWEAVGWRIRKSGMSENLNIALESASGPSELLEALIAVVLTTVRLDPTLPRLLHFTVMELEKEKQLMYELHFHPLVRKLVSLLTRWVADGQLRLVNPEKVAASIIGILLSHWCGAANILGAANDELSLQQRAAEYAQICCVGLLPLS